LRIGFDPINGPDQLLDNW